MHQQQLQQQLPLEREAERIQGIYSIHNKLLNSM